MEGEGAGVAERVCVGCLLPILAVAVEQGGATLQRSSKNR